MRAYPRVDELQKCKTGRLRTTVIHITLPVFLYAFYVVCLLRRKLTTADVTALITHRGPIVTSQLLSTASLNWLTEWGPHVKDLDEKNLTRYRCTCLFYLLMVGCRFPSSPASRKLRFWGSHRLQHKYREEGRENLGKLKAWYFPGMPQSAVDLAPKGVVSVTECV